MDLSKNRNLRYGKRRASVGPLRGGYESILRLCIVMSGRETWGGRVILSAPYNPIPGSFLGDGRDAYKREGGLQPILPTRVLPFPHPFQYLRYPCRDV